MKILRVHRRSRVEILLLITDMTDRKPRLVSSSLFGLCPPGGREDEWILVGGWDLCWSNTGNSVPVNVCGWFIEGNCVCVMHRKWSMYRVRSYLKMVDCIIITLFSGMEFWCSGDYDDDDHRYLGFPCWSPVSNLVSNAPLIIQGSGRFTGLWKAIVLLRSPSHTLFM